MLSSRVFLLRPSRIMTSVSALRCVSGMAPPRSKMLSASLKLNYDSNFLILRRGYSSEPKFNNQKIASTFRRIDGIPSNYELIYRVTFPSYLIAIQVANMIAIISLTFAVVGILLQYNEDKAAPGGSTKPKELPPQFGAMEPFVRDDNRLPTPEIDELLDLSWENTAVLLLAVIGLSLALIRLQRTLPIRLYTSTSRHSYAVFYGHIIPTKTTKREFVAGTLKSLEGGKAFLSPTVFQDATGHQMVLLEHNFRFPSDLNFLLGFKKNLHDEEDSTSKGGK